MAGPPEYLARSGVQPVAGPRGNTGLTGNFSGVLPAAADLEVRCGGWSRVVRARVGGGGPGPFTL
jgi:hypothetical protein